MGLVESLWDDDQRAAAAQNRRVCEELGIELVRLSFPDQHGVLRGKTLTLDAFEVAQRDGHRLPSSLVLKDTSHVTAYPVFASGAGLDSRELTGIADMVLVADPTTFTVLPWSPATAWVLCDIHFPGGDPVRFSTRRLLREVLAELATEGFELVVGIELEFNVYRGDRDGVAPFEPGGQLLTEHRLDELDDVVQVLHTTARALDLPLRSIECELGPSQLEVTFAPLEALAAADAAVLFRSAVKQVCRRHGWHATFMCRPHLPGALSNGWHVHQSLRDRGGGNAFAGAPLSDVGRRFLAGLLAHAAGATLCTTPTVNGYKRYRPFSLAPDRVVWGHDNRGAMLRVVGAGAASRIENRCGEPAANPYLYLASQVVAGLDGLRRDLDPGPATDEPYTVDAERLPGSLMTAIDAFERDPVFSEAFGRDVVDWLVRLKRQEVGRFLETVTDWEQREYFDLF